ncbi:endo-1,4-beta-xylanase [Chitinophaga sp.]|uniref:endo-1,4-beta-xylanase n=1 Tax=Chitinophaga sp. TaxID=1869181 RepID=UPI002BDD9B97|nr:endo-1,4-beta-xylanase [Chitinophaga sp.]HWV66479.1 endo-1,4-beta-xylanase [Chitinophaga sp.]
MKRFLFLIILTGTVGAGAVYYRSAAQQHVSLNTPKTLKEAYRNYFPVGAAVGYDALTDSPGVAAFISRQYAGITPENEWKPKRLQAKEGIFDWQKADKMADFAVQHHLKIRGHTLVWPLQMPGWIYRDGDGLAGKTLLLQRLKTHITTVMQRYKGKAYCWDVVNEAISYVYPDPLDARTDSLYMIAGEEYIAKAFEYAHEADPDARLFYNDNGFEWSKKRDKIYRFLKKLKAAGVPVNGVGMQAHWGIEGVPENYLRETIEMFSDLGLDVQLTELDISLYPKRKAGKILNAHDLAGEDAAYTEEKKQRQADIYKMIFRVCRESKGKVTGITLWSGYDWPNYLTKKLRKENHPYLFDEKLQPKKAFYSVTDF